MFVEIQTVQPGAIVDNKRLSAVLEQVKAQQAAYPSASAARRAAATAEQPRGAGSAVEGPGPTPRRGRGSGLRRPDGGLIARAASLVFRSVT